VSSLNPDCLRAEELASARLDRELSAAESEALSAHLAGCPECRRAAEEHAGLAAEIEAAFRAEPLGAARRLPGATPRARARRPWLRLIAAAAALLAGAGLAYGLLAARTSTPTPTQDRSVALTATVVRPSGTTVTPAGSARIELLGPQDRVDEVIRLAAGEIVIRAAKAAPGRTAVRVETPLGNVTTLGTVFRVKLIGSERTREGDTDMKLRSMVPLVAVALLVGVDQGQVLVTGGAGPGLAAAAEGIVVGISDKVIRAMVSKVEEKDGALAVTIPAGKADGVREGFEFTCKYKDWTGKVVSVAEDNSVLEVKAELKAKVAVRDLAETRLTTVLAEVKPGEKPPEPAPVKVEAVEGLQLVLVKRETVTKYMGYVDKDGNPVRIRTGQNPPEGATEKAVANKFPELLAQLRNVGDKTIVLGCSRNQWGMGWNAPAIKLSARDADGKDVPRMDAGFAQPSTDKSGPPAIVVLKPGQVLEQPFQWLPFRFPVDGKYTIWATLEDQPRPEVMPGVTPWSGKLKSNEIEWDGKVMKMPGAGAWGANDRVIVPIPGGTPGQPMTPNPPDKKEVF